MSFVPEASDVIALKQVKGMEHLVSRQRETHSQHVPSNGFPRITLTSPTGLT